MSTWRATGKYSICHESKYGISSQVNIMRRFCPFIQIRFPPATPTDREKVYTVCTLRRGFCYEVSNIFMLKGNE